MRVATYTPWVSFNDIRAPRDEVLGAECPGAGRGSVRSPFAHPQTAGGGRRAAAKSFSAERSKALRAEDHVTG